jgi:hypothetical protein
MQLDWYARGSEPMVYALGNQGAQVLKAKGEVRGGVQWDTKNRRLSRVFLHHTLAVAEVMVAFEVSCRGREGVRFIPPEEVLAGAPESTRRLRLPFRWQVEVRQGGKSYRLGVEPDGVFGMRFTDPSEGKRAVYFFLEADRGTMPVVRKGLGQTSFARKLLSYHETRRQEIQRAHFGILNFRVLTVTTTKERVEHLVEACQSFPGSGRLFLFRDRETFAGGNVLARLWVNGKGEPQSLLAGV